MSYRQSFYKSERSKRTMSLLFLTLLALSTVTFTFIAYCYHKFLITSDQSMAHPWLMLLVFTVITFIILLFSICNYIVNRLSVPISSFTQAAKRINLGVNFDKLDTESEQEREALQVFNAMQAKIQQLHLEKSQMIAAISHDLRSPITRMRLRAEHQLKDTLQQKFLNDLDEMENLSNKILEYAKGQKLEIHKSDFDLVQLINNTCLELEEVGHVAQFETQITQLNYHADETLIKRAIANLITNANRYGHEARTELLEDDDNIIIHIEDKGPGIPADLLEKVFLPFYRVEQSRSQATGGTGLGLIITRQIINAHDGDITLTNIAPHGLRATITLKKSA